MSGKKLQRGGNICAAVNCSNTSRNNRGLSFFRFPKQDARRVEWIQNSGRLDLLDMSAAVCYERHKLCSAHFQSCMFNADKTRLLAQAVPTLFRLDTATIWLVDDVASSSTPQLASNSTKDEVTQNNNEQYTNNDKFQSCIFNSGKTRLLTQAAPTLVEPDSATVWMDEFECSYTLQSSSSSMTQDDDVTGNDEEFNNDEVEDERSTAALSSAASTQTPAHLSHDSPRKRLLRQKLRAVRQQLRRERARSSTSAGDDGVSYDDFLGACDTYLPPSTSELVKVAAALKRCKDAQGFRYPEHFKQFALQIYRRSPQVYHFLKSIFMLPEKSTLMRMTRHE